MTDSPIVTLRGQRSDDLDALYTMLTQTDVVYFSDELPYMSDETFRDRYSNATPRQHRLIGEITLPSGRNRFVGLARIQVGAARRRHMGHLDFQLHPDHQNGSAAVSFLEQVIAFADRWLGLRRLQTVVYEADTHRLALLEKQGFVREATLRRYAFRDGAYRDAFMMARLGANEAEDSSIEQTQAPDESPTEHEPLPDLTIRGIEADDWEDVADIVRCESVYFNTMQLPYLSRDRSRDRLENLPDHVHMLAAEIDERVVGILGVHFDPDHHPHAASIGMMVHEDYQGHGVGSELMTAAVDLCERWHNISRITLEVYPDNAAGVALYQKFGFEIEGTLRDFAYRAGQYVDVYAMARVREDAL